MLKRIAAVLFTLLLVVLVMVQVGCTPAAEGQGLPVWVVPIGGLLLGILLRTFVPYFVAAWEQVAQAETWAEFRTLWPPFRPAYLSSFMLALGIYMMTVLTVQGAWSTTLNLGFVEATGLAYAGQSLSRLVIKTGGAVAKRAGNGPGVSR